MADSNDILQNLNVHAVQSPNPAPISHPAPTPLPPPDLPTSEPLPFLGDPTDFARFKLKLIHFFTITKLPSLLPSLGLCLL